MDDTMAWVLKSRRLEEENKKKQMAEAAKKAAQLNAMDEEAEAENSDDEAVQKKRSGCVSAPASACTPETVST